MIKKISLLTISSIAYFTLALPVAAIDPCPSGAGGFGNVCDYNANTLSKIINNGITILFVIATLAALFFLILGGIKWITSGGDKGKLEESRNWIIAAIVGLVITFMSFLILNIVLQFFGLSSVTEFTIPKLI